MKAEEIRGWAAQVTEHVGVESDLQRLAVSQTQAFFEIAAQLAEFNETLRVQSALLAGEGSPQ